MTGLKVRVKRNGQWAEIDLDDVADEEWPEVRRMVARFGPDGWDVAEALARWIRQQRTRSPAP